MKKIKYLTLLCIPLLVAGCSCQKQSSRSRQEVTTSEETTIPSSETSTSSRTITSQPPVEVTAGNLSEKQLSKFPSYLVDKLSSYSSYEARTKGETIATVPLLGDVTQTIQVTAIKGTISYLNNESHSSMVDTVHTAYFRRMKTAYQDNDGKLQAASLENYLSIYGTYPFESAIEGYIITGDAVKSVTRTKAGTNYKFTVVFDKEKATNNVKIQMKQFGGLDDYPVFQEDTTMDIIVKNDFTPVSLELRAHYKATKVLETDCAQSYTVSYSSFNETIDIPGLTDEIKDLLK